MFFSRKCELLVGPYMDRDFCLKPTTNFQLVKAKYGIRVWNMQPPPKESQLTTIRIQRRVLQIIRTSPIFLPECAFFLYDGNIQKGVDKSVVFSIHSCNTTILYLLITFTHVPTKYLLPQTNFLLDHAKTNLDIHLKDCYSEHQ